MIISDILLYIAGIIWGLELVPQIYQTSLTKTVRDLNINFYYLCIFAYILSIVGNWIANNFVIVLASIPSVITNLWMIILIWKYRK